MWACARRLPAALAARRSLTSAVDRRGLEEALRALGDIVLSDAARAEFEHEMASAERVRSGLDTELFLSAGADGLGPGAALRLNSAQRFDPGAAEVRVNGALLRLHPLPRSIMAALAGGALAIDVLYERLAPQRPEEIRAAALDLLQHDIITLER
jgi:hypothetical protein